MSGLALDVRLDGFPEPIGSLVRTDRESLAFTYKPNYLSSQDPVPLSISMPLTDEPFDDVPTRAFFDNLLQERDGALSSVMARERLRRDDIAGLLLHLGRDCPGALSVLPVGAPPAKVPGNFALDYIALNEARFSSIVFALHARRPLPDGTTDPSPLAGVQSKIALTLLPNGLFAEPRPGSGAPTTHIIKVPDRGHLRDPIHEAATLELSRKCGFVTAQAEVLNVRDLFSELDVLVITRFDRALNENGQIIRVHQEDFAQALGLPSRLKYERHGSSSRRFDIAGIRKVLDVTTDPAKERESFIRATLFDLLTGNVDSHAKNHALLHLGRGRICVAPRYDLLPTRLDPQLTDELSFRVGAADKLAAITGADFAAFLQALGIVGAPAQRRLTKHHASSIATTIAAALSALDQNTMKAFADLIAANMRQLLPALGLDVPQTAQNRDAFINRGGGWLMS